MKVIHNNSAYYLNRSYLLPGADLSFLEKCKLLVDRKNVDYDRSKIDDFEYVTLFTNDLDKKS